MQERQVPGGSVLQGVWHSGRNVSDLAHYSQWSAYLSSPFGTDINAPRSASYSSSNTGLVEVAEPEL